MKIYSISIYKQNKKYPINNINYQKPFATTTFGNILPYKDFSVPCAYCRRPMIPPSIINRIKWHSPQEFPSVAVHNEKLFSILNPLEQYMHEAEHQVFCQLKVLSQEYPNKSFQELLFLIRSKPLSKLKHKELGIIEQMQSSLDFHKSEVSSDEKMRKVADELSVYLEATKMQRLRLDSPKIFKRKTFITEIEQITEGMENISLFKMIRNKALSMPNSKSDANAFIVKYSDKAIPRSSEEIARNLVIAAFQTFDHVNPRNPLPGYPAGITEKSNALGVCSYCNGTEKGNTPFNEFILRPNVIDNILYHIRFLANAFSTKNIVGSASYLRSIANAFAGLSNGAIKIDETLLEKINSITIRQSLPNGKQLIRD